MKIKNGEFLLGDSLELMKRLSEDSIDLIVTDPPYTMTKRGKSCRPNWMPNSMGDNVFEGKVPDPELWMADCYRVLNPHSSHFYTFCNTNDIQKYLNAAQNVGFKLHNIISMIKDTGMPNRWYLKNVEFILFFRKGKAKPINDMTSRDWIKVEMPKASTGKFHITQKPLSLIEKLIFNSSAQGETILDPFAGSGTTAIAAENLGRKWICIEKDEDHYNKAIDRIKLHEKL